MNRISHVKAVLPMLMALLYGVSPLDIVPDVLPLIGLVDDAILVPTLLLLGIVQYRKAKQVPAPARRTLR